MRMNKRAVVTVYVRHRILCPDEHGGEFYRGCRCPKWLRYSHNGQRVRRPTGTATWGIAEEQATKLQESLNNGQDGKFAPVPTHQETIKEIVERFIARKRSENVKKETITVYTYRLGLFEQFMAGRNKFFPAQVTKTDIARFRDTWTSGELQWDDITRIKAQDHYRSFVRHAFPVEARAELLDEFSTIRQTKEGRDRRAPRPFTDDELGQLIAQVPVAFLKPKVRDRRGRTSRPRTQEEVRRFQTLIRFAASAGPAVRDTAQLLRSVVEKALTTGVLVIVRQKTDKPAVVPVDPTLLREMLAVGYSKHIFWDGRFNAKSRAQNLNDDMNKVMRTAGLHIPGNIFHRFRDTAVDHWIDLGWSLDDVANALGNTVKVVEEHYKKWASDRLQNRMAKMPTRKW